MCLASSDAGIDFFVDVLHFCILKKPVCTRLVSLLGQETRLYEGKRMKQKITLS